MASKYRNYTRQENSDNYLPASMNPQRRITLILKKVHLNKSNVGSHVAVPKIQFTIQILGYRIIKWLIEIS